MDPSIPPIPRPTRDRDRDRDRPQLSSRRLKTPHSISTADANREYTRESQRDRSDRDRHAEKNGERVGAIPPASPEIISSLITSLAVISKPASNHFDGDSYLDASGLDRNPNNHAVPDSPTTGRPKGSGSFGVDYGAFSQPSLGDLQEEDVPLDELAASPPVIRTAKPPSGFSPLTAPKSPKSPKSPRDGQGLKSLLSGKGSGSAVNVSRPSSRGSLASAAESIGNLSIERGPTSPTTAEFKGLRRQRSHDSWGKKNSRNSKGLMYMSSKERLREKEFERKRASVGAVGGGSNRLASPDPDPFLAESVINEESAGDSPNHPDHATASAAAAAAAADGNGNAPSPRPIPTRDSSLRKSGSNSRRASARISRSSKRDSDAGPSETIHESVEHTHNSRPNRWETPKRTSQGAAARSEERDRRKASLDIPLRTKANPASGKSNTDDPSPPPRAASTSPMPTAVEFDPLEEGAPFPAVAQGRRRDRDASADARYRRRSGRQTPDAYNGYTSEGGGVGVKLKRSSSRLKRLSGAAATPDRVSLDHGAATGGNTHTDQPHIAYERPPSADSIDDSVESYLCSPRLSQKIRHPQTGRVISFSEVGDPNGSAVFCCVGMGLTRYITAFYDELALTLKLRLITPDRPGVGDSEPYADGTATPLGWPDDVYAICQSLKITKFSILAHSAGAIYALATALRMPQHIRGRIHLLAPWIPPSQMSVFGASAQTPLPPTNAIPTSQRILRALPTPILKAANSSFMTATSSSITSSLPKQKRAKRERRTAAAVAAKEANSKAANPSEADNKENHSLNHGRDKGLPPSPAHDFGTSVSESMDRIMAGSSTATSELNGTSQSNDNGHQQYRSNSSARRSTATSKRPHEKDERILTAAANLASSQLADRERQQLYDSRLTHAIWQLATTGANPAVDLLVCLERRHTIGFRYVDITRPVIIHHGSRDTRVPVENVKWLGKTMRRCEVRVLEGEGHGLMASAQVMGGVLMEISREWEEWGRVTGSTKRENERARRGTIGQAR